MYSLMSMGMEQCQGDQIGRFFTDWASFGGLL
jgi:hypothetical protein